MILGIGNDLVDIRRIEESLLRFDVRFESRIFTEAEQEYANKHKNAGIKKVAATYAKRFAAKEAFAKALGTGIREGVCWREIEVVRNEKGSTSLNITGSTLEALNKLAPAGMKPKVFLSLSDEYPYAQAQVIISAANAL